MSAETDAAYRAALKRSIQAAADVLEKGGSSMDAVEAAIKLMEDDPLFNAGKGAVFTADGKNELDSAVMDGATMKAGAVAGVTRTRHPISLARAVMEKSPHVMLIGTWCGPVCGKRWVGAGGPELLLYGAPLAESDSAVEEGGPPLPPRPTGAPPAPAGGMAEIEPPDAHKYGTVGVVALDKSGNIAAGTSTGGTQAKALGQGRGFADHRGRNVCVEPIVRGLSYGHGRVFHPAYSGADHLLPGSVQGNEAAGGGGRSCAEGAWGDSKETAV